MNELECKALEKQMIKTLNGSAEILTCTWGKKVITVEVSYMYFTVREQFENTNSEEVVDRIFNWVSELLFNYKEAEKGVRKDIRFRTRQEMKDFLLPDVNVELAYDVSELIKYHEGNVSIDIEGYGARDIYPTLNYLACVYDAGIYAPVISDLYREYYIDYYTTEADSNNHKGLLFMVGKTTLWIVYQ